MHSMFSTYNMYNTNHTMYVRASKHTDYIQNVEAPLDSISTKIFSKSNVSAITN